MGERVQTDLAKIYQCFSINEDLIWTKKPLQAMLAKNQQWVDDWGTRKLL